MQQTSRKLYRANICRYGKRLSLCIEPVRNSLCHHITRGLSFVLLFTTCNIMQMQNKQWFENGVIMILSCTYSKQRIAAFIIKSSEDCDEIFEKLREICFFFNTNKMKSNCFSYIYRWFLVPPQFDSSKPNRSWWAFHSIPVNNVTWAFFIPLCVHSKRFLAKALSLVRTATRSF